MADKELLKEVGQELWGSRFGKVTSLRIATTEVSPLELGERFTNAAAQENLNFGFQKYLLLIVAVYTLIKQDLFTIYC